VTKADRFNVEWTDEQIEELKTLCQTRTAKEIAKTLGRLFNVVLYQIDRQGFRAQDLAAKPVAKLAAVDKYRRNNGASKAAKKFGVEVADIENAGTKYENEIAAIRETLTPEKIAQGRRHAMEYANRCGKGYLAEDFASYCAIYSVTHAIVSLSFQWKNFYKTIYGGPDVRHAAMDTKEIGGEYDETGETVEVAAPENGDAVSAARLAAGAELCGRGRAVFILTFHFGFTPEEISLVLDTPEDVVGSVLASAVDSIRKGAAT